MCGIIGYVGSAREGEWRGTHSLLSALLVESIERGRDATGFVAMTEPLDSPHRGRVVTDKEPLEAPDFVQRNSLWRRLAGRRCRSVVGHVRAATSGTPAVNSNNHPHHGVAGASRFSLVHNGWYTNVRDTTDRYALRMRTDCDTEVAARLIEKAGSIPSGMARCLAELRGAQALAVLDHRTGTTFLCRDDNRPLWVCRLRDRRRVLYASTPAIIARAVEKRLGRFGDWVADCHPLAPGYVYALTADLRLFTVYSSPERLARRERSG
jgi:glucosamine 6-phosphate synthetase-like amidotransferase/phosphosugar isomerase protein